MNFGRMKTEADKRVHFTDTGKHRSAPSTPCTSPTISDISLPDDEPHAPHLGTIPLPPIEEPVRLHQALAYQPNTRMLLVYSVAAPPSTVIADPEGNVDPTEIPRILGQAATEPPLTHMTLVSKAFPVTWAINVIPRTGAYVTVFDVLSSVYTFLRMPLSRPEFATLALTRAALVTEAYHLRVGRIVDEADNREQQSKGVRRIDLMVADGMTDFAGLSCVATSEDVWKLHLA
jgi:hypothetical protein